jgi:hypothetical protein
VGIVTILHKELAPQRKSDEVGVERHTIAIDGTMSTRLFSIAFDLLSPTFVAGACYTPPLLEWLWLKRLAVGDVIASGVVVARIGTTLVL